MAIRIICASVKLTIFAIPQHHEATTLIAFSGFIQYLHILNAVITLRKIRATQKCGSIIAVFPQYQVPLHTAGTVGMIQNRFLAGVNAIGHVKINSHFISKNRRVPVIYQKINIIPGPCQSNIKKSSFFCIFKFILVS